MILTILQRMHINIEFARLLWAAAITAMQAMLFHKDCRLIRMLHSNTTATVTATTVGITGTSSSIAGFTVTGHYRCQRQ